MSVHNASVSCLDPAINLIGLLAGLGFCGVVAKDATESTISYLLETLDGEGSALAGCLVDVCQLLFLHLVAHLFGKRLAGLGVGKECGEVWLLALG